LRRAAVDEDVVEGVLAQLRRRPLVDDAAFARYWVEQRQTFRPRGARMLRAELSHLGVAAPLAHEASRAVEDSAAEDAYRVASGRAVRLVALGRERFAARLGGFLRRRGYDWATTASVVTRLWSELAPPPDEGVSPRPARRSF
jgi:regulatory protein